MDVKEAVTAAIRSVQNLYSGQDIRDVLLEEVERSTDANRWLVTLSFARPADVAPSIRDVLGGPDYVRLYKVAELNASTGELISLKMRQT
jgi:hypothetical protein